jgi:peroxiredoxin
MGGQRLKTSDFRQQKNLVIYFHEGWSCDHCRRMLRELRDHQELFKWLDAKVLAVSRDTLGEMATAAADLGPEILLLSDENGEVTSAYARIGDEGSQVKTPFLVIADRFGSLFLWMGMGADEKIDFHEVEATLLFIATQCPECGRPQGDSIAM